MELFPPTLLLTVFAPASDNSLEPRVFCGFLKIVKLKEGALDSEPLTDGVFRTFLTIYLVFFGEGSSNICTAKASMSRPIFTAIASNSASFSPASL